MRQCYIITRQQKISIQFDNFLTVRDERKLPRVINSWKSGMKLWLTFQLNQSIFLFSSWKSVIVNFGFLNLFLDIWTRNTDPDSEYGSGFRIRIRIPDQGPNLMRIQPDPEHWIYGQILWTQKVLSRFPERISKHGKIAWLCISTAAVLSEIAAQFFFFMCRYVYWDYSNKSFAS